MATLLRPNRLLLLFALLWLVVAIASLLKVATVLQWQLVGMSLLFISLIDALRSYTLVTPEVRREINNALAVGVKSSATLIFTNTSTHRLTLDVLEDYPLSCQIFDLPQKIHLSARSEHAIQYHLQPNKRGDIHYHGVYLLLHSPWGIWKRPCYVVLQEAIKVYPNFATVTKYALLANTNRLGQLGIHKRPRRGEGLHFHQLREYRAGDSLRQIHWHSSARLRKLVSKEYQDERDQNIIFLVDCGQRMRSQDGDLSHFDHTLNALLLLAYVALRQGDALGMMTFSGEQRWFAPHKGIGSVNKLLNTIYDLQPSHCASDYLGAAQQLMHYNKKRALVILISNLRDEDNQDLQHAVQLLQKKHLVLVGSLQEKALQDTLEKPITQFSDALRHSAIHLYLNQRAESQQQFTQQNIRFFDTPPEQLAINLINQYQTIKSAGIL